MISNYPDSVQDRMEEIDETINLSTERRESTSETIQIEKVKLSPSKNGEPSLLQAHPSTDLEKNQTENCKIFCLKLF